MGHWALPVWTGQGHLGISKRQSGFSPLPLSTQAPKVLKPERIPKLFEVFTARLGRVPIGTVLWQVAKRIGDR
ncbi:hypothetical protein HYQ46_009869 [Verticillium longisporum]|nr:hypothetical protein HYQ46_009869 [Verticillium longisporum]